MVALLKAIKEQRDQNIAKTDAKDAHQDAKTELF